MQLRHAGTATALGGLAGGVNAAPTPKRLLSQNPGRHLSPKIPRASMPSTKLHRPASGKKPAHDGLTQSGIGKTGTVDKMKRNESACWARPGPG